MTRIELWLKGKLVKPSECIGCSISGCHSHGIREFDCGFFCKKHFIGAPECAIKGCCNPSIVDTRYDSKGRCRVHEFDYTPALEIYGQSEIANAERWATGHFRGTSVLGKSLSMAIKKHGIYSPTPRKNWFPVR